MAEDQGKPKRFRTLAEFYPYYKSEHQQTVSMLLLLRLFSAIVLLLLPLLLLMHAVRMELGFVDEARYLRYHASILLAHASPCAGHQGAAFCGHVSVHSSGSGSSARQEPQAAAERHHQCLRLRLAGPLLC
jgi:hypothetical protein